MIAAFTFIYALSDTATAPHDETATPEPVIIATPEPPDIIEDPEPVDDPEDEPEDEPEPEPPYDPEGDGFIMINMEPEDIFRGYLLLVNHDHAYRIPDDLDLVNIVEAKNSPYRVFINTFRLSDSIIEPLDEMMNAFIAATGNRSVTIVSAFRTRENQQSILNRYINNMGRSAALRWAALPGHSEHHTGLAFDFGIATGSTWTTFTGTGSTAWFRRNSHRFGFILRYPPNKTEITQTEHEPWHFRYVGLPHSTIMFEKDLCFEEYHDLLRGHPFEDPLIVEVNDIEYMIYFAEGTDVKLPLRSEFELAGNNIDGFIVTAIVYDYDPDEYIDIEV